MKTIDLQGKMSIEMTTHFKDSSFNSKRRLMSRQLVNCQSNNRVRSYHNKSKKLHHKTKLEKSLSLKVDSQTYPKDSQTKDWSHS